MELNLDFPISSLSKENKTVNERKKDIDFTYPDRWVNEGKTTYIVTSTSGSSEMDSEESRAFSTSSLTVVYSDFPG